MVLGVSQYISGVGAIASAPAPHRGKRPLHTHLGFPDFNQLKTHLCSSLVLGQQARFDNLAMIGQHRDQMPTARSRAVRRDT
jgi:hypothetical protein